MDIKRRIERDKDQSCERFKWKVKKLSDLESTIQAELMEFMAETGVIIKDVQLYDPKDGQIQFETDL